MILGKTILKGNIFSQTLQMDTGITIVAPSKLAEGEKYKVAYLLHGLCGNHSTWTDFSMLSVYAGQTNTIFIMPEVGRSFYTNMKYGLDYFSYIADELPNICKALFNISSKREDTMIIGASMGGYGALKCALSRPKQYGVCCAFSVPCLFLKEGLDDQRVNGHKKAFIDNFGPRLIADFEAIFGPELEWHAQDEILDLAKRINEEVVKPTIYLSCGDKDDLHAYNIRFKKEMEKLNFNFTYEEWSGVHDFTFFNEALKRVIDRFEM